MTLGGTPYPGIPMESLFQYLQDGNRMERPADCPDYIYALMSDCWAQLADDRPGFGEVADRLGTLLELATQQVQWQGRGTGHRQ